jgi:mannose-1-phosphate guanylyltransferase
VSRSVLLAGARLEAGAQVVDSVIGPGGVLERGAVASDHTIVGAAAVVAERSRVAGARLQVPGTPAAR